MKRGAKVGIIVGVVLVLVLAPLGYGFVQRTAISSLDFDFDKFELTDIDFSETQTFGSVQNVVLNAENPSISMLDDIQSLRSSIATPETFLLDLIANTRLTYSMFVHVSNPSIVEAVIDRAQVDISINGKTLPNPIVLTQQYRIGPGQTAEIELKGISVSGKEAAVVLYNLATDKFVLDVDFAVTSYFPTIFGEMPVPATVNLQMYLVPPKPSYKAFAEPGQSPIQQASYDSSSKSYQLSFMNENNVPISGELEVGVLKGNFLCNPACIAPIDSGFATFVRIKGSSLFDVQVFRSEALDLKSGDSYTMNVADPVLRSNANSAFITRWAPDYDRIPYIMNSEILGIKKTSTGEYQTGSFATVRKVAYHVVNDFGYVGSQEFVSPDKSTILYLSASDHEVAKGSSISFSGRLTDKEGNGISGKHIVIKDDDPANPDDFLVSTSTDISGEFRVSWTAEDTEFWDNVVDVYAAFEGDPINDGSRSNAIGISVSSPVIRPPVSVGTHLTLITDSYEAEEGDFIHLSGRLTDSLGNGLGGTIIYIKDEDSLDFDDQIATAETANDGTFSITWQAERTDPYDNTIELYAVFEGSSNYERSISPEIQVIVIEYQEPLQAPPQETPQYYTTTIGIDLSSQIVDEGDIVTITGTLTDDHDNGLANALVYIYDEDPIDFDDVLGTVYTNSAGEYYFEWVAMHADPYDNSVEIYAVFEGSQYYSQARSVEKVVQVT